MNKEFEATADFANIYSKILDYLARQDYSEAKLLEKVLNLPKYYSKTKRYENYTRENVEAVIEVLKEKGLIDENKFLERMLERSLSGEHGLRRIQQKMYQRRYKKENIKKVLDEFQEKNIQFDLTRISEKTKKKKQDFERKYKGDKVKLSQIRGRLFQFLGQKGYGVEEINKVLKELYPEIHLR